MTWMFHDGTIDHLEHAWMPQVDGAAESFGGAIDVLYEAYAMYHKSQLSTVKATVKVDDAMSCLVKEQDGIYSVAYKGRNPCWYSCEADFGDAHDDKDEKLRMLLKYAPDIIGRDRSVQYQVGFMAYDPDGLSDDIRPNVVDYWLPGLEGQKLAVVLVTKSKIDHSGDSRSTSFTTDIDHMVGRKHTEHVYFYDNDLYPLNWGPAMPLDVLGTTHVVDRLRYATYLMEFLHARGGWQTIVVDDWMQIFLNEKNREGWDATLMYDEYLGFFNDRWARKIESLKTQRAKDRWNDAFYRRSITIMDSRHLYEVMFELCDAIRNACILMVKEVCPKGSEGIVVSRRIGNEGTVAWKAVDPDFTVRNHEKWRQ